jgi:hypothetical protein
MNPDPQHDALPEELKDALQSLGGVQAPRELADRVALARLGQVQAPAELRHRVELAAFGKVQAPAVLQERVAAEVKKLTRPILPFGVTWRRTAAAAILVGIGVMFGPWSGSTESVPNREAYLMERDALLENVFVIEVPADELSEASRSLAAGFGAPLPMEGAE